MDVSVVRKLADVVAVDLQLLSADGVSWSAICAARFGGLCAAGSEGVEELVLSFVRVRREARGWSRVFLFQVVPLPLSVCSLSS
jgi:hypothetical protein